MGNNQSKKADVEVVVLEKVENSTSSQNLITLQPVDNKLVL